MPCKCGGEPQLESFQMGTKPRKHFVRCWGCERLGPDGRTPDEAVKRWDDERKAEQHHEPDHSD
jgi:hypothetical protein